MMPGTRAERVEYYNRGLASLFGVSADNDHAGFKLRDVTTKLVASDELPIAIDAFGAGLGIDEVFVDKSLRIHLTPDAKKRALCYIAAHNS